MSNNVEPEGRNPTPAPKPRGIRERVMDSILATARRAACGLTAMGISPDKIDPAAKAYAKVRADRILDQAVTYADKLAEAEVITPAQILDEIARQAGIKLETRKSPCRKNPPKKGGQDG